MKTITVNPSTIRKGDRIATGPNKSRVIRRVDKCETQPEAIHLDQECYDSRFNTIQKVVKP